MSKPNLKNHLELKQWIHESCTRIHTAKAVGGDPEMATANFAGQLVDELLELYKSDPYMAYGHALAESELSDNESRRQMWLSACKVLDERLGLKKENEK